VKLAETIAAKAASKTKLRIALSAMVAPRLVDVNANLAPPCRE
jgi:hypothetical protein